MFLMDTLGELMHTQEFIRAILFGLELTNDYFTSQDDLKDPLLKSMELYDPDVSSSNETVVAVRISWDALQTSVSIFRVLTNKKHFWMF